MTTTSPERAPWRVSARALRGSAVRIAELIATPLVPADYLDLMSPLHNAADLRGRIIAVHSETRDAVTVVIAPGRGWRTHTPGQYVRVGVDVDGVRQWRAYSLTSPTDRADSAITITVKAIPDGVVSNHLVRRARTGTIIALNQACGEFVLPDERPRKVLFVTAGSGITPVMGMLRNVGQECADITVIHSAPTAADVIFADELRQLAAQDRIRLIEVPTDLDGMLDVATLPELVPDRRAPDLGVRTWRSARRAGAALRGHGHRRAAAHRTLPPHRARHRRGRHSHLRSRERDPRRRRGNPPPRRRRVGRCAHAVGVPHGHLLRLCRAAARGRGARPAQRRHHTAAPGDGVLIQTCVSAAAGTCSIDL